MTSTSTAAGLPACAFFSPHPIQNSDTPNASSTAERAPAVGSFNGADVMRKTIASLPVFSRATQPRTSENSVTSSPPRFEVKKITVCDNSTLGLSPIVLVAPLITETADESMAREAIRLTARALFPVHPGGLALQYSAQFPPPVEQSAFHRLNREAHKSSGLSHG